MLPRPLISSVLPRSWLPVVTGVPVDGRLGARLVLHGGRPMRPSATVGRLQPRTRGWDACGLIWGHAAVVLLSWAVCVCKAVGGDIETVSPCECQSVSPVSVCVRARVSCE